MRKRVTTAAALVGLGAAAALSGGPLAGAQTQQSQQEDSRLETTSVTFRATPARDRRRPHRFTVRGRVTMPPGLVCPPGQSSGQYCLPLPRERACENARVQVRYKRGRLRKSETVSVRRAPARSAGRRNDPPFCVFRKTTTFRDVERIRGRDNPRGFLKVQVRFLGNAFYQPKSSRARFVRAG